MTDTASTSAEAARLTAVLHDAIATATEVIDGVDPADLARPTPCEEWDVRGVINHMTAAATMFAIAAEIGSVPTGEVVALAGDVLGDDFRAAWRAASRRLRTAFEDPSVLEAILSLPFGAAAGHAALAMAAMDPFEAVLELMKARMTDDWRVPGILGPEQRVSASSTAVERLLAYAGRQL